MATQADWIKVELSEACEAQARGIAHIRQSSNAARGYRAKSLGTYETHLLGARGELAVCAYLAVDHPGGSYAEAKRRGDDVSGWQVRAGRKPGYGLGFHPDDHGRFIWVLGHEAPVMWLCGWIDAAEGLPLAQPHREHGFTWYRLNPIHLHPLDGQNGYSRRGDARWLVDPQTPFWCETCSGMHPIIEHHQCRLLASSH